MTLTWTLNIDWNGDGTPDVVGDGGYLTALEINRGRNYLIRQNGRGFERMGIGKMRGLLKNTSGRYDPYNTSSALYPNVLPGGLYTLTVSDGVTSWPVMAGRISDLQPESADPAQVVLTGNDGWQLLHDSTVDVALQNNQTTGPLIGMILDAAGWPAAWGRSLSAGADTLSYWWASGRASEEIGSLVESELGFVFIDASGQIVYRSRHDITAVQATVTGSHVQRRVRLAQPWDVVRNHITIRVYPRVLQSGVELWRMQDVLSLSAGVSATVWADFIYNNSNAPAQTVTTPVAGTDYTANSAADGSGTDLTSSLGVVMTTFGENAKLVLTNNASQTMYITLFKLRGDAVTAPNPSQVQAEDTSSQARYGKRAFAMDDPWVQSILVANDFAVFLSGRLGTARAFAEVRLRNQPALQFGSDLGDKIRLTVTDLQVDANYRLVHIRHKWLDRNGQLAETTWLLEPDAELDESYWFFPATFGVSTKYPY